MVPIRSDSHCKQSRELSISILRVTKLICGENRLYSLHCTSAISGFIFKKPERQSSQCFYVPGANWLQCFLTGLGRLRSQSLICHSLVFPYSVKIYLTDNLRAFSSLRSVVTLMATFQILRLLFARNLYLHTFY